MMDHYILDRFGEPQPCDSLLAWAQWMSIARQDGSYRVAESEFAGVRVSTVFLGLDHSFDGARPILWETMVFSQTDWSRLYDELMLRYATRAEAEEGHAAVVARLQGALRVN